MPSTGHCQSRKEKQDLNSVRGEKKKQLFTAIRAYSVHISPLMQSEFLAEYVSQFCFQLFLVKLVFFRWM